MKTETQSSIKDAIAGGWGSEINEKWRVSAGYIEHYQTYWGKGVYERVMAVSTALLDPRFWEALGKTRNWSEPRMMKAIYEGEGIEIEATGAFAQQLHFSALLADGKTIDEALGAISQGV